MKEPSPRQFRWLESLPGEFVHRDYIPNFPPHREFRECLIWGWVEQSGRNHFRLTRSGADAATRVHVRLLAKESR